MTHHSPHVSRSAAELGVDLSAVVGTGVGGRVTLGDVRAAAEPGAAAAAGRRRDADASMVPNSRPAPARRFLETRSSWLADEPALTGVSSSHPSMTVTVDAYALNPLLDDLRQAKPSLYEQAMKGDPPPALFQGSQDLPVFTATGFDPVALLRLPWQARHAAAATTSQAEVKRIFDQCAGEPAEAVLWAAMVGTTDSGNAAYRARMKQWALYSQAPGPWAAATAGATQVVTADQIVTR